MLPSARPTVSSSSTLWATASKEWVIPAKPKPGRKPKKDTAPANQDDNDATDSKGRRVQNRAAQRAFRERKQSQLAELQARIQMYEQGEIERNVALQSVAKRLKEENEKLRQENALLNEKVTTLERERDARNELDNKRWREDTPGFTDYPGHPSRKRMKLAIDTENHPQAVNSSVPAFTPSPPSMVSSPGSNDTSDAFSPIPLPSPSQDPAGYSSQMSPLNDIFDFQSNMKPPSFETNAMDTFDCGFCNDNTPCVCREIAMQSSGRVEMSGQTVFKIEAVEQVATISTDPSATMLDPNASSQNRESILDNLPAYQPAVPLRRRPTNTTAKSLFPVSLPPAQPVSSAATCSGDPSNCMACADDVFGKAFCTAIGDSVAAEPACADCPSSSGSRANDSGTQRGCCGNSASCSRAGPSGTSTSLTPAAAPSDAATGETMPTSDAWRQLKSHPNVAFSDLSLLAEVVARRSKCTGPRVVISPAPGTITPERSCTPQHASALPSTEKTTSGDGHSVLLTDPHAHYHQKQQERSSPPMLVPQEELIKCGRPRLIREVRTDAVQEALRLLDAKFT
ncbi:hypothetical protein DENSPDRAFT_833357 [Dentipellis sp. KUC8613]|nr:hypothetical protein DENSPDRAFT_833357 [Dentipellis sp. KUC8613]